MVLSIPIALQCVLELQYYFYKCKSETIFFSEKHPPYFLGIPYKRKFKSENNKHSFMQQKGVIAQNQKVVILHVTHTAGYCPFSPFDQ